MSSACGRGFNSRRLHQREGSSTALEEPLLFCVLKTAANVPRDAMVAIHQIPAALVLILVARAGNRGNHGLKTFPGTSAAEHCPQATGQWPETTRSGVTDG